MPKIITDHQDDSIEVNFTYDDDDVALRVNEKTVVLNEKEARALAKLLFNAAEFLKSSRELLNTL